MGPLLGRAVKTTVTLVVRSRSSTAEPLRLFEAVARQRTPPDEIVVVDSGSAPALLGRLEAWSREGLGAATRRIPLRLLEIRPASYTSAGALNRGCAAARGDLVAVLSQDALPATGDYLERLARAFEDPTVAGAYARQIPAGPTDPLVEKDLLRTYPPLPRLQSAPDCWFVNTCSMVRRELWRRVPFDERAGISEDHGWARHVQALGYVVAYRADAVVRHHHPYRGLRDAWRRYAQEGAGLAFVHGRRCSALRAALRGGREIASDALWLGRRAQLGHWPRAVARRVVKHVALYRGGRRGVASASHR